MGKRHKQISTFSLTGRFLNFVIEDGYKIKRLWLETAGGEHCIKLSKESRASIRGVLTPGDWIRVFGEQAIDRETNEVKYKAYLIQPASPGQVENLPVQATPAPPKTKPKATVLVCQKSDCMKRGGKAMCQALQETLSDRGLQGQVAIKGTGCMKHCKAGPNLVIMPDKTRYSHVAAKDIPTLIDKHFPQLAEPELTQPELVTIG